MLWRRCVISWMRQPKKGSSLSMVRERTPHQLHGSFEAFVCAEFRHYLHNQALELTKESHDLEKTITGGNISPLIDSNGVLKTEVSAIYKRLLTPSHQMDSLPKSHFAK